MKTLALSVTGVRISNVIIAMKRLVLAISLSALGVTSVARADDLLQSYEIRDGVNTGVITKIFEDDRGVYYWGAFQWNDPGFDPDNERHGIFAFMKPQGSEGHVLYGTEFEGELHGARQPLFNLAESEIDYFNTALLPQLRVAAPWIVESGSVVMRGYALGIHFNDSEDFFKVRAKQLILPEEPLFGIGWRRNDQGRFVPHYDVTGDAGIAVGIWPYKDGTRKFWTTVAAASRDRLVQEDSKSASQYDIARPLRDLQETPLRKNLALTAERRRTLSERRSRELAEARQYLEKARRPGIVYKGSAFWTRYGGLEMVRRVFEGNFTGLSEHPSLTGFYRGYVKAFYSECEHMLPVVRKHDGSQNFETVNDGFTRPVSERFYVEMDPLFYEAYMRLEREQKMSAFVSTTVEVEEGLIEGDVQKIVIALLGFAAPVLNAPAYTEAMRNLLRNRCTTATTKQLGKNFLRLVNGDVPVQQQLSERFAGASAESEAWTNPDIERLHELRRYRENVELNGLGFGWIYHSEELKPLSNLYHADLDVVLNNPAVNVAYARLADEQPPVLHCYYGPKALSDDGKAEIEQWMFWYKRIPEKWQALAEADASTQTFMKGLQHAIDECPESSNGAREIAFGK